MVTLMENPTPAGPALPSDLPAAGPAIAERAGRPRRKRGLLAKFVLDLGAGALVMLIAHAFLVQISVVRGHSMEPSLHDGDRLMVDRVSHALSGVDRFDVVVLRYPRDPEVDFVKRVIGVPGDVVALENGHLVINGRVVSQGFEVIDDHDDFAPVRVPVEHYFVLGDNRPISCDSREFDFVPGDHLKGKVRLRFWPLDRLTVF